MKWKIESDGNEVQKCYIKKFTFEYKIHIELSEISGVRVQRARGGEF